MRKNLMQGKFKHISNIYIYISINHGDRNHCALLRPAVPKLGSVKQPQRCIQLSHAASLPTPAVWSTICANLTPMWQRYMWLEILFVHKQKVLYI